MRITKYLKRFKNYMKFGGETYLQINQIHSEKLLEGKNVVITGGTSGIGYEIAKKCIDLGAKVLITGRTKEKLEDIKSKLNCEVLEWDISNIDIAKDKISKIVEIFDGKIDCFINNAGIYKSLRYNNCSIDEWNQMINTDLTGVYFATREIILQCFEKNNKGNIIMMASLAGVRSDEGPYGISKAGVIHMTRSLAKTLLNKNIRINAIAPGITCSNINPVDEAGNVYLENTRGKRILSAKEIADIAVFLISDSSVCLTGQVINADNGETIL
jgi:NAD(P)-dependent dehydrogenase (short-subunit alcohol dehydrogenase family)